MTTLLALHTGTNLRGLGSLTPPRLPTAGDACPDQVPTRTKGRREGRIPILGSTRAVPALVACSGVLRVD
jgi:hypothetical protein